MKSRMIVLVILVLLGMTACSFTGTSNTDAQNTVGDSETTFVYIKIPESIMPVERGEKYEDPLDNALQSSGLGEVTGGGTQLGKTNPDGSTDIDWVGIDVDLSDTERGIPLLVAELKKLGVPKGTTLEYRVGEEDVVVPVE